MKLFYVYVDWTLEERPRSFYVGKGERRRVSYVPRNKWHSNISRRYGWRRTIVAEFLDEDQAYIVERQLILAYQTYAYGGSKCWGANLDLGGRGGKKGVKEKSDVTLKRVASLKKTLNSPQHQKKMACASKESWSDARAKALDAGRKRYWATSPVVQRDALIVDMLKSGLTAIKSNLFRNLDLYNVVYRATKRHQKRLKREDR